MLTARRLHAPNEGFERFKGVVCTLQAVGLQASDGVREPFSIKTRQHLTFHPRNAYPQRVSSMLSLFQHLPKTYLTLNPRRQPCANCGSLSIKNQSNKKSKCRLSVS